MRKVLFTFMFVVAFLSVMPEAKAQLIADYYYEHISIPWVDGGIFSGFPSRVYTRPLGFGLFNFYGSNWKAEGIRFAGDYILQDRMLRHESKQLDKVLAQQRFLVIKGYKFKLKDKRQDQGHQERIEWLRRTRR